MKRFFVFLAICFVLSEALPQTLVGHWPLDGDLMDISGLAAHGTDSGSTIVGGRYCESNMGRHTQFKTIFWFPNQSEWDFATSNAYSISLWLNPTMQSSNFTEDFLTKWGPGDEVDDEWILRLTTGDSLINFRTTHLYNFVTDHYDHSLWSTVPIPANKWSHIAATFAIAGGVVTKNLYINGQLVATDNITGQWNPRLNNTGYRIIAGNNGHHSWERFNGSFDDIRYYDGALSAAQVADLYSTITTTPTDATCGNDNGEVLFENLEPSRQIRISWGANSTTGTSSASGDYTLTGVGPGTHDFLVEYSSDGTTWCCAATVQETVGNSNTLTFSASTTTATSTCGGSDGTITIEGLSPTINYDVSYDFGTPVNTNFTSNGSGELTITGLSAGFHSDVTVTDGACSVNVGDFIIVDPSPINISNTIVSQPSCSGSDGAITFEGLDPNTFYDIDWEHQGNPQNFNISTNGTGQLTISSLDTGSYTSIIISLSGCSSPVGDQQLTPNNPLNSATIAGTNPTTCNGTDGNILFTALDINTNYSIDYEFGGPQTQVSLSDITGEVQISSLGAGSYSDFVITLGICSRDMGDIVLAEPSPPTFADTNITHPGCDDDDGVIEVTGLSISTSFNVSYTNGSPTNTIITSDGSGNLTLDNLSSGTYSALTISLLDCPAVIGDATLTLQNSINVGAVTGNNPTVCGGTEGSIYVEGLSPSTTYAVTYDNGTIVNANITTDGSGDLTIPGLAAGSYTSISATEGLCVATISDVFLVDPASPNPSNVVVNDPSCTNGDGSIVIEGLNPSAAYEVSISDGGLPSTSNINTDGLGDLTLFGLDAGTYTNFQVSLAGCTASLLDQTLSLPGISVGSVTGNDPTTCGANDGSIVIDGLNANTSYSLDWTLVTPATTPLTSDGAGILTLPNLTQGNYTNLQLTEGQCTESLSDVLLSDPGSPTISTTTVVQPTCAGGAGSITLEGLTPGTPYQVSWTFDGSQTTVPLSADGAGEIGLLGLDTGSYSNITVSLLGCVGGTGDVDLTLQDPITITDTSSTNPTSCLLDDGSIQIEGLTPSTTYDLEYFIGVTPQYASITSDGAGTLLFDNLDAGIYDNVEVILGSCSQVAGNFVLLDPSAPVVSNTTSVDPSCAGGDGALSFEGLTPSTTYDLSYSTGGLPLVLTPTSDGAGTITIAGLDGNTYTSITISLNGCATTITDQLLTTPTTFSVGATSQTDPSVCSGTDGSFLITGLESSSTYSLAYDHGGGTSISLTSETDGTYLVNDLDAGSYTSVEMTYGSCTANLLDFSLSDPSAPVVSNTSITNPGCVGNDGELTFDGLTPNTTYLVGWTTGGTPQSSSLNANSSGQLSITGLDAGTVSNISIELAGCATGVSDQTLQSTSNINYDAALSTPESTCSAADGSIIITGLTANTNYTLNYENPSLVTTTTSSNSDGELLIFGLGKGTYSNVELQFGTCTEQLGDITVDGPEAPSFDQFLIADPSCANDDGLFQLTGLDADTDYDLSWTFNTQNENNNITTDNNGNLDVAGLAAGTYSNIQIMRALCVTSITDKSLSLPSNFDVDHTVELAYCENTTGQVVFSNLDPNKTYDVYHIYEGTVNTSTLVSTNDGSLYWTGLSYGNYAQAIVEDGDCDLTTISFTMAHDGTNCDIDIPNAFTPNGDDVNDRWHIQGSEFVENLKIQVFNRWGNTVYTSSESPDWDGTMNGKSLPTGTYYYVLSGSLNGQDISTNGDLNIVR